MTKLVSAGLQTSEALRQVWRDHGTELLPAPKNGAVRGLAWYHIFANAMGIYNYQGVCAIKIWGWLKCIDPVFGWQNTYVEKSKETIILSHTHMVMGKTPDKGWESRAPPLSLRTSQNLDLISSVLCRRGAWLLIQMSCSSAMLVSPWDVHPPLIFIFLGWV